MNLQVLFGYHIIITNWTVVKAKGLQWSNASNGVEKIYKGNEISQGEYAS